MINLKTTDTEKINLIGRRKAETILIKAYQLQAVNARKALAKSKGVKVSTLPKINMQEIENKALNHLNNADSIRRNEVVNMTKFDSKRKKLDVDWDSLVKWEEDNKALVIWAITPDCIRERMKATNNRFAVNDNMIYEFCYHSRRGWDMEAFKNAFKDFVIWKLKDYTDEQQES